MRIVTFNLRVEAAEDGINRFFLRQGMIIDKIRRELPEVLGFQECGDAMGAALRRGLGDLYDMAGCGREADCHGESNMVAFRRDALELLHLDTFWLSPTPRIPGSRFDKQSACPRICTCAALRCVGDGKIFRVYNTHLDHISDIARQLGAAAVMARILADYREWPLPLLLTGDFNATPESMPVLVFTEHEQLPLRDLTEGVGSSFHNFGRISEEEQTRIDFIMANGVLSGPARRWEDYDSGMYLSDHYPLEAGFTL